MATKAPRIKKIKRPGIYTMPAELYHMDPCPSPSLSASLAKVLVARSPAHAHYAHPKLNPNRPPDDKEAFDVGKAAHDALLEGVNRIEIVRFNDWRTNAAKEARDAARAKGLIPLLEKNYDRVAVMVQIANAAIASCEDLSGVTLADGKPEQTLVWEDIGTWCRARPDWLHNDHSMMLDYKTVSSSAEPNDVMRTHVIANGWDLQSAFYRRGLRCVSKKAIEWGKFASDFPKFIFLAQEIDPPYACSFIGMPPSFLALGEQKVNDAIRIWADCLHSGKWPTYPNRIYYPDPPAWAEARHIEKMGVDAYEHLLGGQA